MLRISSVALRVLKFVNPFANTFARLSSLQNFAYPAKKGPVQTDRTLIESNLTTLYRKYRQVFPGDMCISEADIFLCTCLPSAGGSVISKKLC